MKTENMHIAELAMFRQIEGLYRCDSMPPQRAYWFSLEGWNRYVRPDGTYEEFDFRVESDKYKADETWRLVGFMPRLPPDGALDLPKLQQILEG